MWHVGIVILHVLEYCTCAVFSLLCTLYYIFSWPPWTAALEIKLKETTCHSKGTTEHQWRRDCKGAVWMDMSALSTHLFLLSPSVSCGHIQCVVFNHWGTEGWIWRSCVRSTGKLTQPTAVLYIILTTPLSGVYHWLACCWEVWELPSSTGHLLWPSLQCCICTSVSLLSLSVCSDIFSCLFSLHNHSLGS